MGSDVSAVSLSLNPIIDDKSRPSNTNDAPVLYVLLV